MTAYERGQGPSLHLHPYPEVFVVQAGAAAFRVGDDTLRVVSVHPSATVQQTDLY